jgi:hypothetical protein
MQPETTLLEKRRMVLHWETAMMKAGRQAQLGRDLVPQKLQAWKKQTAQLVEKVQQAWKKQARWPEMELGLAVLVAIQDERKSTRQLRHPGLRPEIGQ